MFALYRRRLRRLCRRGSCRAMVHQCHPLMAAPGLPARVASPGQRAIITRVLDDDQVLLDGRASPMRPIPTRDLDSHASGPKLGCLSKRT
jgi:hypothetical protein